MLGFTSPACPPTKRVVTLIFNFHAVTQTVSLCHSSVQCALADKIGQRIGKIQSLSNLDVLNRPEPRSPFYQPHFVRCHARELILVDLVVMEHVECRLSALQGYFQTNTNISATATVCLYIIWLMLSLSLDPSVGTSRPALRNLEKRFVSVLLTISIHQYR